jgi:hypothetical protein
MGYWVVYCVQRRTRTVWREAMSMSKFATSAEFKAWKEARNKMLREMDVEAARNAMGPQASDELVLLTLHKVRYECTDIEDSYRHESAAWLRDRGYERMTGTPLLPEGALPE